MDALVEDAKPLVAEIARLYAGIVDGPRLTSAFRESLVWLPTAADDPAGSVLTADYRGVHWLYAFTGEAELARFAMKTGGADRPRTYLTARGWRVLDVLVPAMDQPAGVAVDAAGKRPMFLPPSVEAVKAAESAASNRREGV
ncbi:MAG TPA: hypothetical protein VF444_13735 [Pseudonocardiaceae bacterium]